MISNKCNYVVTVSSYNPQAWFYLFHRCTTDLQRYTLVKKKKNLLGRIFIFYQRDHPQMYNIIYKDIYTYTSKKEEKSFRKNFYILSTKSINFYWIVNDYVRNTSCNSYT